MQPGLNPFRKAPGGGPNLVPIPAGVQCALLSLAGIWPVVAPGAVATVAAGNCLGRIARQRAGRRPAARCRCRAAQPRQAARAGRKPSVRALLGGQGADTAPTAVRAADSADLADMGRGDDAVIDGVRALEGLDGPVSLLGN